MPRGIDDCCSAAPTPGCRALTHCSSSPSFSGRVFATLSNRANLPARNNKSLLQSAAVGRAVLTRYLIFWRDSDACGGSAYQRIADVETLGPIGRRGARAHVRSLCKADVAPTLPPPTRGWWCALSCAPSRPPPCGRSCARKCRPDNLAPGRTRKEQRETQGRGIQFLDLYTGGHRRAFNAASLVSGEKRPLASRIPGQ